MKHRLALFAFAFLTGVILLYAAVRFSISDTPVRKILINSNTGTVGDDLRLFLTDNAENFQKIADEIPDRFPNIESATVKNNRNGVLEVEIRHKKIVGVWMDGDKLYPLLENGSHINIPYPPRSHIPVSFLFFKGPVPANVSEIIETIGTYPGLGRKADHLEYVENRRWNIRLVNGGTIMLPEQNAQAAVNQIKALGILGKSFKTLDLRDVRRPLVKQ